MLGEDEKLKVSPVGFLDNPTPQILNHCLPALMARVAKETKHKNEIL